ncbi:MAG TPA: hypothetical protein VN922_02880 [Bacteroidia bacterium]|nr:hypothetical protein [Bacteroidia bacterium]
MDFYKTIDHIKQALIDNHHETIADEITSRVQQGSTGSEILMIVGFYLKELKESAPQAYALIKEDAEEFISECNKIGLFPG